MALPGTKATTSTTTHAVVQVVENYIQNQNLLGEIAELDDMLCDLVDMHKDNILALKRVLQCIYNLLQTNSRWNVKFGQKLFHKLISVVISESRDDSGPQRQLVANVLVCVHLHAKKFRSMDGKFLLYQLWSLSISTEEQPHAAQILVHLFDDFVQEFGIECYGQLVTIIQSLLQSPEIEHRKSAYFLMGKLLEIIEREKKSGLNEKWLELLQCSELQWSTYVTIMENLEEQQSHLILPSLTSLMPRLNAGGCAKENWLAWQRILYARLFQNNNILVLRWTLKYILTNFELNQLVRLNLLDEFLQATNRTQLFNVEGDKSLLEFQMDSFLTENVLVQLIDGLTKVSWHCVPLVYWLHQINPERVPLIPQRVLFELSSRVRALQNKELRQYACGQVLHLFKITIDGLLLSDYMLFIEALYSASDICFQDYGRLIEKIQKCDNMANAIARFNQRFCEIVGQNSLEVYEELIRKCENLSPSQHGWWRLVPIFAQEKHEPKSTLITDFYRNKYNIDVSVVDGFTNLESLQIYLLRKLNCESKQEKSFVLQSCVDYFVRGIDKWELISNPIDMLEQGSEITLHWLVHLLYTNGKQLDNENVLSAFLVKKKKARTYTEYMCNVYNEITEYAKKFMNPQKYDALVSDLIDNHKFFTSCVSKAMFIKGVLYGETPTGDARIEAAYVNAITGKGYHHVILRRSKYICTDQVADICKELLKMNNELSKKKPRYYENSKEHRMKIRIAVALSNLLLYEEFCWSNALWDALLEPSNQLNISYIYECIVGKLLPNEDVLFERLRTLSSLKPSQQVPLISVAHIYFMRNSKKLEDNLENIFAVLLPHTMGPHFQTRLLAQLVLHSLASKSRRSDFPIGNVLIQSIEATLGDKIHDLQSDPRLMFHEIYDCYFPADMLLYITNTPFDECSTISRPMEKLKRARAAFKAKSKDPDSALRSLASTTNGNVQRKMNPFANIFPKEDLSITNEPTVDYDLIVVASLIDKLPNLGGLARTCEVFGVKTLIIANRSVVEKGDFTNISMTAEKTLNIEEVKPVGLGEFLLAKQVEGYKIVGAEQTAHSTSFANFRFPKKCILLLGHEKHGIPVDLIGYLDHAVEIPQFGMVRSLNVHVTGSLFIWEFCKQNVLKK